MRTSSAARRVVGKRTYNILDNPNLMTAIPLRAFAENTGSTSRACEVAGLRQLDNSRARWLVSDVNLTLLLDRRLV